MIGMIAPSWSRVLIRCTRGDVSYSRTIHIGAKIMRIGPNLYDALLHCRSTDKPAVLWADGVCINQRDVSGPSSRMKWAPNMSRISAP